MRVTAIYKGTTRFSTAKTRNAMQDYARGQGLGEPAVIEVQDGSQGGLLEALGRLDSGDVAIIERLADLGDTPSAIASELQTLASRGVELWSMDLGHVDAARRAIRAGLALGTKMEQALRAEQKARKGEVATWSEMFSDFQRKVGQAIVKRFGPFALQDFAGLDIPDAVKAKAPAPTSKVAPADLKLIGKYVAGERVAERHTQAHAVSQIADILGKTSDVSAVSRAEHGENLTVLKALAQRYAPDLLPGDDLEETLGPDYWPIFATVKVRAAKARDAAVFSAELAGYEKLKTRKPNGAGTATSVAGVAGNPFADATRLQGQLGEAAASGIGDPETLA